MLCNGVLAEISELTLFGIIVTPLPLILVRRVPFQNVFFIQQIIFARNSKDVDALKFQLVRHDTFYNGQNQQDSTECLPMLINIIHL